jgi:hypothetical protein
MSNSDLKKSLYQAFKKALGSKQSRAHATQHIVRDILDPNMIAEAPQDIIPANKENVLQKDISISEMHQQKQAQAEAQLGMPPKMPKTPKMPQMSTTPKMPKINKAAYGALFTNEEQGMEKPEKGINKLKKFMEKCEMKKAQKSALSKETVKDGPLKKEERKVK